MLDGVSDASVKIEEELERVERYRVVFVSLVAKPKPKLENNNAPPPSPCTQTRTRYQRIFDSHLSIKSKELFLMVMEEGNGNG